MKNKRCIIFSAIHPLTQKEIPVSEKKTYLGCKYWKESKKEADLFFTFYRGEVWAEVHRIIGILSGELLNAENFDDSYEKFNKAFNLYYFASHAPSVIEFPELKAIIDAIKESETYPKNLLLDDVLLWACENELINPRLQKKIEKNILISRSKVFGNTDPTDDQKIQVISLFISENKCIFYPDAKELLFPDSDLLQEMKAAFEIQKIQGFCSKDKEIFYLNMRSFIKWLMREGYFPERFTQEFLFLKIESIKESKIEYQGKYDSLHKLTQQEWDRNDLLGAGMNGELSLYLKYPRKYLQWRERSVSDSENQSHLPDIRYDGFGQLKRKMTEDRHFCHFGGLTVDMLFFNETPCHELSKLIPSSEHEIEFVPTKEEAKYGLQPYIKFPDNQLQNIISDHALLILHGEHSLLGKSKANKLEMETNESGKPEKPAIKRKQHELRNVIKRAYEGEKKRLGRMPTNTEVWGVINNLDYDKDELIQDMNNEKVEWLDWKGKSRSMKRATFNNYITALNDQ